MPLPSTFNVDFSRYRKDLISQALSRMLSQHYDKCVLRQFVAVFVSQCQELYDACLEMQRIRTAYVAEEENLDALGRIVGADRTPWEYDENGWFFFDRQGQSFDQVPIWCIGGPIGTSTYVDDIQYRVNVIAKAIKNHTLTSSVPELLDLIGLLFYGTNISFEKTGPNQVRIIVPSTISTTHLILLTKASDDEQVDNRWYMNYPATLDVSAVVMFGPDGFMMFDRYDRRWDYAPMAVGVNMIGVN